MSEKKQFNIAIIGNPSVGKSTLIGNLYRSNQLSEDALEELNQAFGDRNIDHSNVMSDFINNRGDGVWSFETPKYLTTLYEIADLETLQIVNEGTVQIDHIILVISAITGIGEREGDLSKEYIHLAKELGIGQIAVAINHMNATRWCEDRYSQITKDTMNVVKTNGPFHEPRNVAFVPLAVFGGGHDNLLEESPNMSWFKGWMKQIDVHTSYMVKGKTLLDAIDAFVPVRRR